MARSWELVNPQTWNVVAAYDSEEEAQDAAAWYLRSFGQRLLVKERVSAGPDAREGEEGPSA